MECNRLKTILLALILATASGGVWLYGQAPQAQVLGTVVDASGAAIPGATVILKNEATGVQLTTTTTSTGDYTFLYLDSGTYTVTVQKQGFDTAVFSGNKVQVLEKKRVDAQLKVGQLTTSVEVKGSAAKVDTDSAAVGMIVSHREVTELPLNGREFDQLAVLMPGVREVSTTGAVGITAGASFALQLQIGGGHAWKSNNYSYDGVDNTFTLVSGAAMNPSIDSIQEFRIDRSQFQAEFGRGSNQIELVTRGGTNRFHGTAWEYLRNGKTSAGNYYTHEVEDLKRNQYGVNIGGPIQKDKAFFFFNWEGQKLRTVNRQLGTVLTPKQRIGDLSELLPVTVHNPFTGAAYEGNIIPAAQINPVSTSLINAYLPLPNLPGVVNNYLSSFPVIDDWNQYIGRVDYNLTDKDRVSFRFSGQPRYSQTAGLSSLSEPTFLSTYFYNIYGSWQHNFTSNTMAEFRYGYHKEHILQQSVPRSHYADPNIVGVGNNVPIIQMVNPYYVHFIAWNFPADWYMKSSDIVANLTHIRGAHTIKLGFEYRTHGWTRPSGPGPEHVNEYFQGQYTGSGVGDYLLGYPYSASTNNNFIPTANGGDPYGAFFVQDDWKISPRVTINLGLRYDLMARRREKNNLLTSFDPLTGKVVVAGSKINEGYANPAVLAGNPDLFVTALQAELPKNTLAFGNYKDFSPRFGFAFRPWKDNKTVIRGGYGMFYMTNWESLEMWGMAGTPYGYGGGSVANTIPPTLSIQNPFAAGLGAVPQPSAYAFDPHMKDSYMQQFTLGIQRELPWGMVGEVSFQDQHSIRLDASINWNQSKAGVPDFPYPRYQPYLVGSVSDGHGRYDALELLLRKNSVHYTFQFSYVWAKDMSRLSPEDPYNRDMFYGPGGYAGYVPTEAKVNFVVDLPAGKGRRFLNHGGALNAVLGGWTASSFFILHQGGQPMTPTTYTTPENVSIAPTQFMGDFAGARPDRICNGKLDNPTVDKWFDTSCFVTPRQNTFGNSGTGILFGPSTNMHGDFGIFKNFSIREDMKLQFRAEMFNTFNHPSWNYPDTALESPNFGKITSKSQTPRVFQFALRLNF